MIDRVDIGDDATLYCGDCLDVLPTLEAKSVHCVVTSPPYWGLRDYGVAGQFGLEPTPDEYVEKMVGVFQRVWRVLRDDGTVWLNLGDSYAATTKGSGGTAKGTIAGGAGQGTNAGSFYSTVKTDLMQCGLKPKDLIGIPWRVALALQADGWYLRQDIIWHKPNPMPESVTDRCTKAHEYVFLLSKQARYWYDAEAVKETAETMPHAPGWTTSMGDRNDRQVDNEANDRMWAQDGKRNRRSVWTITTKPFAEAHFATFPPELAKTCILAGCPEGGTVLDPFSGAGTTAIVALKYGRKCIGIELSPDYQDIAVKRIRQAIEEQGLFRQGDGDG
jgi:site-specific DNA-methyltransferase (adenine-specific)